MDDTGKLHCAMENAKFWIIQYYHRYGTDAWPWFADQEPTEREVVDTLKDWEGDKRDDEWIEILGPFEMPGEAI